MGVLKIAFPFPGTNPYLELPALNDDGELLVGIPNVVVLTTSEPFSTESAAIRANTQADANVVESLKQIRPLILTETKRCLEVRDGTA